MAIWYPKDRFQQETLRFIVDNETIVSGPGQHDVVSYACGCQCERRLGWHLCELHEGFDIAVEYLQEQFRATVQRNVQRAMRME